MDQNVYSEEPEATSSCSCFGLPCFGRRGSGEGRRLLDEEGYQTAPSSWWVEKLKKVRELSEVWAGPKWKNLIRKMGAWRKQTRQDNPFQYDSFNYALNFDDQQGDDADPDRLPYTFSARFTAPRATPAAAASQMAALRS